MANVGERAENQLREITECPICLNALNDPRMLPCIHTFCFECLKRTSEAVQKKPGDKVPCPLCRKEFTIPPEGIIGLQRNFFMENFLEFKTTLQMGSATIICDTCNIRNEGKTEQIPKATMRCLECQDNYCDSCVKVHQFQKLNRNHQVVKIESDTKSGMKRVSSVNVCTKHIHKTLDYYCAKCKKIVCVSCFVEDHKLHDCKDVATVDEEFRQTIEKNAGKILTYANEIMSMRKNTEKRKANFLQEIFDSVNAIRERNQQLKDMIYRDTKSLLNELSVIKSNHLKQMDSEMEEADRMCTILESFEAYCTELRSKGSASDICSSVDQLIARADDLEKDHEAFIGRPRKSVEVSFQTADLGKSSQKSETNFVGQIKETTSQFENYAIVVGLNDGTTITKDVIKINLHRSNEVTAQEQIPTTMANEAVTAVYCNTMYATGIDTDQIWKYNIASGWKRCASLVQGRRRHSAAFIDEVLYICGGFVDSDKSVLDSVEAYNVVNNKCAIVGKLVHCVQASGNCVPFKSSLYIFCGLDKDGKAFNHVQVYNSKDNVCTLLSKPMPCSCHALRGALWDTFAVLLGRDTCFIFNFEKQTWQERKQFKTGVFLFGLVLENERIFVIGGGIWEKYKDGTATWKCRDDVRYVPLQNILDDKPIEWKMHAKLPKQSLICAIEKLTLAVPL